MTPMTIAERVREAIMRELTEYAERMSEVRGYVPVVLDCITLIREIPLPALSGTELENEKLRDLLREWSMTEMDSMDEEFEPWLDSFSARVRSVLSPEQSDQEQAK